MSTRRRLSLIAMALIAMAGAAFVMPRAESVIKRHWGQMFNRNPDQIVRLWEGPAPLSPGTAPEDVPTLRVYLPNGESAHSAVLICPGGAYRVVQRIYEGDDIALRLNEEGIAAFVLIYRVSPRYRYPAPLLDATRAMRWIRSNASRFGIDPHKIGIAGFSAGGHLASTMATHYDGGNDEASDPVERMSSRPDFAIFGYSILSAMPGETHEESIENLFGDQLSDDFRRRYTSYLHVDKQTPPTFLFHTKEDAAVPYINSVRFYDAMKASGGDVEMVLFEQGRHGAGLANGLDETPYVEKMSTWPKLLAEWLRARGLALRRPAV